MIRVILVDRQELFRQSFKSLIESDQDNHVVFSSNSFYETRMKLCTDCGDVLITDVSGIGKEGWLDLEEIMHQLLP